MGEHLAYGDIIRIYCTLQDSQDKNQKSGERSSAKIAGFLMSKGFADNNIYFLKSKKFTEFEFRNSLFEILPYSSFEIHDENKEREKNRQKGQPGQKSMDDQNRKSRMDTEKEQFLNKINKNKGFNINFDSEIVIRHVNSESYLQGQFSCPETGIGSFKLVLTNQYSSLIKFKIIRFRNSDKEAEEIQSKDQFRLFHCASHCFLNIGNQEDEVFLDKLLKLDIQHGRQVSTRIMSPDIDDIFDQGNMFHGLRPIIKKPTSTTGAIDDVPKRFEVVNQSKATLILNFMPEKNVKTKQQRSDKSDDAKGAQIEEMCDIEHNDVVFLKNTKNDSYLSVDLWSGDVYLKKQKKNFEGLWQICVKREPEKGGIVSNSSKIFYLKHYITDAVAKVSIAKSPKQSPPPRQFNPDREQRSQEYHSQKESSRQEQETSEHDINKNLSIKVDPRPQPRGTVMRLVKYPNSKGSLKHRDLVVISVLNLEEGKELQKSMHDVKHSMINDEGIQSGKHFIDIAEPIKKIRLTSIEDKCQQNLQFFKLKLCKGDIENTFQIFKFDQKKLLSVNKILSSQQALIKFCDILIVFNKMLQRGHELVKKRSDSPDISQSPTFNRGKHRKPSVSLKIQNSNRLNIEDINASPKQQPVEQYINRYLNSYILMTICNTTKFLKDNCKTGNKAQFDFMIMIRSFGVIEILVQMIYFIEVVLAQWDMALKLPGQSNISKRKYQKDRLLEILKQIYQLLTTLSSENSCKTYMARWLKLFLKQYYKLKKQYMHQFILKVLDDSFIVKSCIEKDNIAECINNLKNTFTGDVPDEKYLQLLSSFCKCKNEAVPGNQDYLIKNFLKFNQKCVYRFELKHQDLEDGYGQDRKSSAAPKEDIKIITKNKQNQETAVSMADHAKFRKKQLWSYTVTLLNLIAQVSYDQPLSKQIMYSDHNEQKEPSIINTKVVAAFFKNYREEDDDTTEVVGKSKSNNIFEPFLKLAHFYIKEQTEGVKRLERNESVIVWSNQDEHENNMPVMHNMGQLFENITSFFFYLFDYDLKLKTYNIKKLKTIETALDFIKTLMKTKSWTQEQHDKLIQGIRLSVLKLKPSVIYNGVNLKELQADMAKSRAEREKQERFRTEKQQNRSILGTTVETEIDYQPPAKSSKQATNIYKDAQKIIQKNYKKLVDNKQYIRLLIDTRRLASEILDIHLDIINNHRLSELINKVFLRLYQNNFDTGQESTDPYSHRYRMNHPQTWVKEIKDKCENDKARLKTVRCLIECFFVDSLKVVDKMLVLMFKMYESRKNLLNSFSRAFICYQQFFVSLYNDVKDWMASYEKMKPNGNYDEHMKKLQKFSYCIRNPISTTDRRNAQSYMEAPTPNRALTSPLMETMEDRAIKQDMLRYEKRHTLILNENESRFNQRQEQVQKMLMNTKIHEFVMKYGGIVKPNAPYYNKHIDIVFEFMTLLVFDNLRNKKEVTPTMLKFCQKHLRANYKAIDFLMEMIRNNKAILSNKQTITNIAKTVLSIMSERQDYLLKAKLMDVLRMCCIQNNLPHSDNQTIVLNLLQNKSYFQKVMFETDQYVKRYDLIFGKNRQVVDIFDAFTGGMMKQQQPSNSNIINSESDLDKEQEKEPSLNKEEEEEELEEQEDEVSPPSIYRSLINDLEEYKNRYSNIFSDLETNVIEMSPLLQYMTSYFSMMCSLVEGNHSINVGKCSNIHKYESLLLLLRNCEVCWPLAKYVRGYINRLYYGSFSDKQEDKQSTPSRNNSQISIKRQLQIKAQFFVDKIFETQLPLFNDHLEKCTQYMYDTKNLYFLERTKILDPFRYEYIVSYMYMFMMETLEGLKNILGSKQYKQAASDKLKTHENADQNSRIMLGLLRNLGEIYKRYRHMTEQSVMKKIVMELFEHSLATLSFMDSSRLGDIPEIRANVPQLMPDMNTDENTKIEKAALQDKAKYLIKLHFFQDKEERGNKRQSNEQSDEMFNEQYKTLRVSGKTGGRISNSDREVQLQINLLLESVIDRIKDSPQIKQMAEEQLNELVELCCSLDSRSDVQSIPLVNGQVDLQNVTYSVITENVFLTQLIKLITKSPDHLKNEVKIKAIRFLRLIFQKKVNSACKLDSSRWQSSYFKKGPEKQTLEMYQKQFLNLKLGQMIVKILETKNASSQLLQQTFMLGVRYLFNGFTKCQQSILEKLREDSENEVMTQLCLFIRNIRNQIEAQKFKMEDRVVKDQQNKQELRPAGNLVDSYNYYDRERNCMIQARVDREKGAQSNSDVQAKIKCVCYTFNFLQLLCQNDNTDLKQFLRQQTNADLSTKYNSVNFLAETTKLFKVILQKMPDHPLQKDLIKYIAQFLVEVTMIPCITNQRQLCNTTIFQDITGYIQKVKMQNSSKLQQGIIYLMDFVINVGLSLLQGNEDTIYDNILKALNAKFLRTILEQQDRKLRDINAKNKECPTYTNITAESLKILMKEDKSDPSNKDIRKRLESIFNLLALVKKLSHYQKKKKIKPTLLQQMTDTNTDKDMTKRAEDRPFEPATTQKLCAQFIEHIEVAHNGKKQFLYFPKLPIFDKISSQTTNYIHENVKRDTQIDKITDFLSKSEQVNNEMSWNYKVLNRLGQSSETLDNYRFSITILTIAIEIIFIVCSSINFTLNKQKKQVVKMIKIPGVNSILHFLTIIQLFSSMYFLYVWVTLKYRLAVEREQQKSKTELDTKIVDGLLNKIDKDQEFDLKDYWQCAKLLYQHETEIFNTLFFIVTSLLGCLLGYEYYSLMVFDVLARNKILKNVIQAITLNMKQLFYVSLLILVFVYVFNMISVEFDLYLPYIYEAEEEKCQVLSDCIMSLYTSGIVGTKEQDVKMGRYFTDLIYIVIMQLLFSNIVSGIMIDTFAQLRDHRKTIEADKQNQCFICGISKATIEKRTKEAEQNFQQDFRDGQIGIFQHHTRKVHIEWNYIYYLYMLKQKDITAYTGIEYAIKKQMKDDQYKWVPIEYEKNENDVQELLELLSQKLKNRLGDQKGKGK